MTEESWDLVVVGAGPAGASAALGALGENPSLRVLLLDRDDFPRDKCCGDGIAPHVFDALAVVGVTNLTSGGPRSTLEMACRQSVVRRPMARPARVIPREVFDARLVGGSSGGGSRAAPTPGRACSDSTTGWSSTSTGRARRRRRRRRALRGPPLARAPRTPAPSPGPAWLRPHSRRSSGTPGDPSRRAPSAGLRLGLRPRGRSLQRGYGELLPRSAAGATAPTRDLLLAQLETLLPGASEGGTSWRGHHLPLTGWRLRTAQRSGRPRRRRRRTGQPTVG